MIIQQKISKSATHRRDISDTKLTHFNSIANNRYNSVKKMLKNIRKVIRRKKCDNLPPLGLSSGATWAGLGIKSPSLPPTKDIRKKRLTIEGPLVLRRSTRVAMRNVKKDYIY